MTRRIALGAALMLGTILAAPQEDAIFTSEIRLVPLNVTVSDKSGHLVTDLPQSAFQVFENNVRQPIKIFKREDVPVSLGLVIDNSGSMREKLKAVESASLALVKDSNPQDEVFIVNFNDEAYIDTCPKGGGGCLTGDTKVMQQALAKIDARGETAMRSAMKLSIAELKRSAKRDKKVLLVITDGVDNASPLDLTLANVIREAQQSDVLIYAIGLLSDQDKGEARRARHDLDELVQTTGGLAFYPQTVDEVDTIAHQVAHDIRNQYSIVYSPLNTVLDGAYRRIKVVVKGPNNPVARTRQGYFAPSK